MTSCLHRAIANVLVIALAGGLAGVGCAKPQNTEPPRNETAPRQPGSAQPAEEKPAPDHAAQAPAAPAPPRDLASATRDNPLRPENPSGSTVRNDIGAPAPGPPDLKALKLPPGFSIEIYTAGVTNARSLALGAPGTLYVSTRRDNRVYAVVDRNRDRKVDKVYTIAKDLDTPNGIAYKNGSLYIAQIPRLLRIDGIDAKLANPPKPVVINDQLPKEEHHGWRYIKFGPDGWLYMPVGAPCNICKREEPIYSTIARMKPDGTGLEVFASGVRNSVGFDWHPDTKDLWFTENGRDSLGNDIPGDELNRAPRAGMHFGFPYCHAGNIVDPEFGAALGARACSEYEPPVQVLDPHVAALGMRFYTGAMFPAEYKNAIIFAEHGSWNRDRKLGFRVMVVKLDGDRAVSYEPFITGWLDDRTDQAWGRPVDVELLDDGSLLVSDDWKGVIYRVTYRKGS